MIVMIHDLDWNELCSFSSETTVTDKVHIRLFAHLEYVYSEKVFIMLPIGRTKNNRCLLNNGRIGLNDGKPGDFLMRCNGNKLNLFRQTSLL